MMLMRLFTVASPNRGSAEEKGRVYTNTNKKKLLKNRLECGQP
jgi:hypothetical protein